MGDSGVPASVWLCAPEPGEAVPFWAQELIARYSAPGERVSIHAAAGHPGLAADTAALLAAAHAQDRHAIAVLPTPAIAADTRTLLHTLVDTTPADTTPAQTAPVNAAAPVTPTAADTATRTQTSPPVATAVLRPGVATGDRATVLVGRHPDTGTGGADSLVIVVTGPVRAGARPGSPIEAAVWGDWSSGLRPGGVFAVLCSPNPDRIPARHRHGVLDGWRTRHTTTGGAGIAALFSELGLTYLQHLVLLHADTATVLTSTTARSATTPRGVGDLGPDVLEHGREQPRPDAPDSAPFVVVHTEVFLAQKPPAPDPGARIPGPTPRAGATR